jgi:hypothetical protein
MNTINEKVLSGRCIYAFPYLSLHFLLSYPFDNFSKVKLALKMGHNDAAANLAWEEAEKCGIGGDPIVRRLRDMILSMPPLKDESWKNKASFHYD